MNAQSIARQVAMDRTMVGHRGSVYSQPMGEFEAVRCIASSKMVRSYEVKGNRVCVFVDGSKLKLFEGPKAVMIFEGGAPETVWLKTPATTTTFEQDAAYSRELYAEWRIAAGR